MGGERVEGRKKTIIKNLFVTLIDFFLVASNNVPFHAAINPLSTGGDFAHKKDFLNRWTLTAIREIGTFKDVLGSKIKMKFSIVFY